VVSLPVSRSVVASFILRASYLSDGGREGLGAATKKGFIMGDKQETKDNPHPYERYPDKTAPSPVQVLGSTALKGAAKDK